MRWSGTSKSLAAAAGDPRPPRPPPVVSGSPTAHTHAVRPKRRPSGIPSVSLVLFREVPYASRPLVTNKTFFFPLLCVRSQQRREDRTKVVCCRSSPLLPNFLATSSSEAGTHSPPPPLPPAMDEPAVWKPSIGSRAPLTRRDCEFAAGGTALACARSVYADKPNTSPPAVSRSPAGPRYHIGNLVHHHLAILVDLGAAYLL